MAKNTIECIVTPVTTTETNNSLLKHEIEELFEEIKKICNITTTELEEYRKEIEERSNNQDVSILFHFGSFVISYKTKFD